MSYWSTFTAEFNGHLRETGRKPLSLRQWLELRWIALKIDFHLWRIRRVMVKR